MKRLATICALLLALGLGVGEAGAAVLATDTFSGTGNLSANWTVVTGFELPQQNSGVAQPKTVALGALALNTSITWPANQCAEMPIVTANGANRFPGVVLRGVTGARTNYQIDMQGPLGAGRTITIRKYVAGVPTILTSQTATINTTDVLKGCAFGSVITAYLNGVALFEANDATHATGSPGFTVHTQTGAVTDTQVGTWTGSDSAASGLPSTACSGSSPNLMAASASESAVQACYTVSVAGDTITVPAGSGSWSGVHLQKNVSLVCATPPTCLITGGFKMTNLTAGRVAGFTFSGVGNGSFNVTNSNNFRIDHNVFVSSDTLSTSWQFWGGSAIETYGLIDHNDMTNMRLVFYGETTNHGQSRWSEPENMGTVHAVYLEDNVFSHTCPGVTCNYPNTIDGNWGSRIVSRFNTFNSGRIEQHGVQAIADRGVRIWELYYNTVNASLGANYRPYFIRGGTGVVFHDSYDGGFNVDTIDIDGPRQGNVAPSMGAWGYCDGASFVDGNTATFEGWLCRDQIGASTDASLWNAGFTNPAPVQAKKPAYFWKNLNTGAGSTEIVVNINCTDAPQCTRQATKQIVGDRDYYIYSALSSSTQTTGVREGTLAAMAAVTTCTQGVGFWATDGGSNWNTSASNPYGVNAAGADGALYVCGASNNWVLTYTPYTYPHPLQSSSTPPAPAALTEMHMANFTTNTSAVVIWTASTDPNHAAYNIYRCTQSGTCTNLIKRYTPAMAAAAHSPETRWVDATIIAAGTYSYCVADENLAGYIGACTTAASVTVTGKQ